jgi:hypothetical protein
MCGKYEVLQNFDRKPHEKTVKSGRTWKDIIKIDLEHSYVSNCKLRSSIAGKRAIMTKIFIKRKKKISQKQRICLPIEYVGYLLAK